MAAAHRLMSPRDSLRTLWTNEAAKAASFEAFYFSVSLSSTAITPATDHAACSAT